MVAAFGIVGAPIGHNTFTVVGDGLLQCQCRQQFTTDKQLLVHVVTVIKNQTK